MKLLDDNGQIIHVDISKDIIQHYGKKGMKWGQIRALKKEFKTLVKENGGKRTVGYHMALRESKKNSRIGTALKSKRSLRYRIDRLKEIRDIGDDLNKQLGSLKLTKRDQREIREARKNGKDFAEATKGSILEEKMNRLVDIANKRAAKTKIKY